MTDKIVILSTCANEDEAERLARVLLDARLAACISVIPRVRSFYRWKGAVETADECLLLIKSSRPLFGPLKAALEKVHSYEVPEAIAVPIVEGAENYLGWMADNLRGAGERAVIDPGLAFIFDMDGVIVDSNPVHREAWAAYNRRFGLETTGAMQERMYGRRNDDIVRDFFGGGLSAAEVAARGTAKEELYRQMIGERIDQILVPGVRQFLDRYRAVPMGLASNAERENIDFLLDRARLRPYFRVVVDGHEVRNPKPDPEIYLKTAELLKIIPANCIVFEDSYSGVDAARAAGMRVVGVSTTYEDLPGSTMTIDNFLGGDLSIWLSRERAI